jgi:CheY-like chemotaxis protein
MRLIVVLSVGLDSLELATRSSLLQSERYIVVSALSLKEAVDRFLTGDFDLVLLDNSLPTKDRDRLTCLIRASGSRIPLVEITGKNCHDRSLTDAAVEDDPSKLPAGIRHALTNKEVGLNVSFDGEVSPSAQRERDI